MFSFSDWISSPPCFVFRHRRVGAPIIVSSYYVQMPGSDTGSAHAVRSDHDLEFFVSLL